MHESKLRAGKRKRLLIRGRSLAPEGETSVGGMREGLGGLGLIAVHSTDVLDHTPARPSAAISLLILVKYRCQGPELY